MEIKIDHRSGIPIYIQIMDQIRHNVASGQLKTGDQLPTVRQLAADLRVNWNTVARAYRLLDDAGLISTQQGRGTFIWESLSPEADQQLRLRALQALTRRYLAEVHNLGCTPEDVKSAIREQTGIHNL
jgi:GntR family transcriptional regulator